MAQQGGGLAIYCIQPCEPVFGGTTLCGILSAVLDPVDQAQGRGDRAKGGAVNMSHRPFFKGHLDLIATDVSQPLTKRGWVLNRNALYKGPVYIESI